MEPEMALTCEEVISFLATDPQDTVIELVAAVLESIVSRNDSFPVNVLTHFHARSPPPISIKAYITRFAKYAPCGNECFVLALIYLDRVVENHPEFVITSLDVHRLLITALTLASKFCQDKYFTNSHYAKVGGLPCCELNMLEMELLTLIEYKLFASSEVLAQYYMQMRRHGKVNIPSPPKTSQPAPIANSPVPMAVPMSQTQQDFLRQQLLIQQHQQQQALEQMLLQQRMQAEAQMAAQQLLAQQAMARLVTEQAQRISPSCPPQSMYMGNQFAQQSMGLPGMANTYFNGPVNMMMPVVAPNKGPSVGQSPTTNGLCRTADMVEGTVNSVPKRRRKSSNSGGSLVNSPSTFAKPIDTLS
eukprot:Colp12_sorted_trinity150504_noHs@13708